MMFTRPAHQRIADALAEMDGDRLARDHCYFGGGTAIVLKNGEYRQSLDVDFLCADTEGYRRLRESATAIGAPAFFGSGIETLRPFRTDQYGLRAIVEWKGQAIRFEIVREARIALDGAMDPTLGIPILSLADQFAEKLLANADRCLDRSIAYRDAIDIGYLVMSNNGEIPAASVAKAEEAYGRDIAAKAHAVVRRLAEQNELRYAAETLDMSFADTKRAAEAFAGAAAAIWR